MATRDSVGWPRRVLRALIAIYLAPGAAVVWFRYMFPEYGKVVATGRRKKSKGVQAIYSFVFWMSVGPVLLLLIVGLTSR